MTRLLVIKPSSLGDVIHGLPALRLIKQRLGKDLERVTWVVNDSFASLLELSPDVDRILRFPRRTLWQRGVLSSFIRELQSETYDIAIDFQGLLRSGIMSWLSHAPRRIGFADGRECSPWFYNQRLVIPKGHAVARNLQLAAHAFPLAGESPSAVPAYPAGALLNIPEDELAVARQMLQLEQGRRYLAVGHSSRWNSKNWSIDFFATVLDRLAESHPEITPWLLGAPNEAERAQAVLAACHRATPLNLAGKSTMRGLAALLALSGALLTNDSGPMHLAAAMGIPTIALFGATNPDLTGPFGPPGLHRIVRTVCPLSPCFKHDCPYGPGRCAQGTDPEAVAHAVIEALSPATTSKEN